MLCGPVTVILKPLQQNRSDDMRTAAFCEGGRRMGPEGANSSGVSDVTSPDV